MNLVDISFNKGGDKEENMMMLRNVYSLASQK